MTYAALLFDMSITLLGLLVIRATRPTIDYAPPIYEEGFLPVETLHTEQ